MKDVGHEEEKYEPLSKESRLKLVELGGCRE